jgi:hypothetical protein
MLRQTEIQELTRVIQSLVDKPATGA